MKMKTDLKRILAVKVYNGLCTQVGFRFAKKKMYQNVLELTTGLISLLS